MNCVGTNLSGSHFRDGSVRLDGLELLETPVELFQGVGSHPHGLVGQRHGVQGGPSRRGGRLSGLLRSARAQIEWYAESRLLVRHVGYGNEIVADIAQAGQHLSKGSDDEIFAMSEMEPSARRAVVTGDGVVQKLLLRPHKHVDQTESDRSFTSHRERERRNGRPPSRRRRSIDAASTRADDGSTRQARKIERRTAVPRAQIAAATRYPSAQLSAVATGQAPSILGRHAKRTRTKRRGGTSCRCARRANACAEQVGARRWPTRRPAGARAGRPRRAPPSTPAPSTASS